MRILPIGSLPLAKSPPAMATASGPSKPSAMRVISGLKPSRAPRVFPIPTIRRS
jgi:hypothetical protein